MKTSATFKVWRRVALLLIVACGVGFIRAEVSKEYQIKAAFLYNFTKFVEWPPAHFASEHDPITIGVLGKNPFAGELKRVVQDRKVNGREIATKQVESAADLTGVDLLFVRAGDESTLEPLVTELRTRHVLTVGESPAFAAAGGVITFVLEGDKVRFEIDATAAERSQLKLSAQLLKLARIVHRKA